jgi:hypothetical protein
MRLMERAIARDPHYGPALAWAAFCCYRLVTDGRSEDPVVDRVKGTDFARRALEAWQRIVEEQITPSPKNWEIRAASIRAASSRRPATASCLEFASVVDAVRCAVEVQREMSARNDFGIADFTANRTQRRERALLVLAHQARIACDIDCE